MLTCVKCNSEASGNFNFKHKEGKARNLKSMTTTTLTFLIPTCKNCIRDFKIGRFILKMLWGFSYVGFLLLIFGIIPSLFYPSFFYGNNYGIYLMVIGIVILILSRLIKLLISKLNLNPNDYIKYKNGLLVNPKYTQNWIPYDSWIRSTVREK